MFELHAIVLVIHLIIALAIIAVVLLQPAEAGGLTGGGGSMSNMMTPRRSADTMTRLTTILAGCFFLTSLVLAIMAGHRPKQEGILDIAAGSTPVQVTAPVSGNADDAETATEVKEADVPKPPAVPETPKAPLAE